MMVLRALDLHYIEFLTTFEELMTTYIGQFNFELRV